MNPGIFPGRHGACSAAHHRQHPITERGFTLYELLIVLAIASGLSLGAVNLFKLVHCLRTTNEINELLGHLSLARSEAIKRQAHVVVCPTADQRTCSTATDFTRWEDGILVFVDSNQNGRRDADEDVIRIHPGGRELRIKTSRFRSHVAYQPSGLAGGSTTTFTFCGAKARTQPRYVIISNTGRARVSDSPPDGKADDGLETCA
jgi:type IV fimbrial biogenesis protein FimT